MAALAVCAKLSPVDVGMAIGAMRTGVIEDQAGMALRTGYLLVHAPQRIRRMIMIEFGIGADRLPTGVGVAILARNREWAVRIGDLCLCAAYLGMSRRSRLLRGRRRPLRLSRGFLIPQREESRC